jgi:hypothetical protein
MPGLDAALAHQRDVSSIAALAERDLKAYWWQIRTKPPLDIAAALKRFMPSLSEKYGLAAAELAAQWYEDERLAANAPGRYGVQVAETAPSSQVEALAGWGVSPMFSATPNATLALSNLAGGLGRLVLGADRGTISQNALSDPARPVYTRIARSNGCAFCKMLATRGAVYGSSARAGGAPALAELAAHYHDHCHCTVSVSWDSDPVHSPEVDLWTSAYTDATRQLGGASDTSAILSIMRQTLGTN